MGVYECFHCGERAVTWMNDFSFEEYGLLGEGFVHVLQCGNCGAYITYEIPDTEAEQHTVETANVPDQT